jgi:hypothetical protein
MEITMKTTLAKIAALLAVWLGCAYSVRAAERPSHEELINQVAKLLLAVADPPKDMDWPPKVIVIKDDEINAFATLTLRDDKGEVMARPKPLVAFLSGIMDKVILTKDDPDPAGAPDRLAYIMGHEISHLLLKHVVPTREKAERTEFLKKVYGRDQEIAADLLGAELSMKAGFSHKRGMECIRRMVKAGLNYSSFEGLGAGHPSWDDRITLLDKKQAQLWRSMSAFNTGTYFLMCEQYPAAEACYRHITTEFPNCHEAWANLGYVLLMQYCDALDADDLRGLKLGQVMVGGFYRRPKSFESMVRSMDAKIWKEAVAALEKSEEIKPGQVIVQGNLGLAYLVHPSGKPQVAKAWRYLEAAAAKVDDDENLDAAMRAAILVNAGVADVAGGRAEAGEKKFARGQKVGSKYVLGFARVGSVPGLDAAVRYNRAMMLAASKDEAKRKEAAELLEIYLQIASPASVWWTLGFERYTALCKELKRKPVPRDELAELNPPQLRMVTSVKLQSGPTLVLSQPIAEKDAKLGQIVPAVAKTKLTKTRFADDNVDVLSSGTVVAILLNGPKSPPLSLRPVGGGNATKDLRVGMDQADCMKILESEPFDVRNLDDPGISYTFFPRLGLGMRAKDKKVAEFVIAQIPRQRQLKIDKGE